MPKNGQSGQHAFGKALSRSASLSKKSTKREMHTGCRPHQQSQRPPPLGRAPRQQPLRQPPSLHWGNRSKANKWPGYSVMGRSFARHSRKDLARVRGASASSANIVAATLPRRSGSVELRTMGQQLAAIPRRPDGALKRQRQPLQGRLRIRRIQGRDP